MTGDEVQRERINRGISRRALARQIDVPEQTLRRLERGDGISLVYAKRIADYFDVTVLELLPEKAAA